MSLEGLQKKLAEIAETIGGGMVDAEQAKINAMKEMAPTPAQAAVFGSYMMPGSSIPDVAGELPVIPSGELDEFSDIGSAFLEGERAPSLKENIQEGNYLDAGLQGLGLAGDALTAVAPPLAAALKAPRAIQKTAQAGSQLKPLMTTEAQRHSGCRQSINVR